MKRVEDWPPPPPPRLKGMPVIDLVLDGDGCWPELAERIERGGVIHTRRFAVAVLTKGMASGRPSVMFRLDLEDGAVVLAETSLALLLTTVDAIKAAHGDPRR